MGMTLLYFKGGNTMEKHGFTVLKEMKSQVNINRVLALAFDDKCEDWEIATVGMLVTVAETITKSEIKNEFVRVHDKSDSYQIRPKAVYKGSKGYYIRVDRKTIFLDEHETKILNTLFEIKGE